MDSNLISKLNVNGTTYDIVDNNTITSINGKTGAIGASDIAAVLTADGYKLTDTDTNTARLKVQDTSNRKIATSENTDKYIQFTGGTNKVTVTDGTNSFDVTFTPSITNNVTGSGLTADKIVLGNGNSTVKTSSKAIVTSLGSDNTTVPTSKAVKDAIAGLSGAMHFIGTVSSLPTAATNDSYTNGDVILVDNKEYVRSGKTSSAAGSWVELGDEGSYALKNTTVTGTGVLGGGGALSSNQTITHNTSGVTAATYGPSANVDGSTSTSVTINVPQITVDSYGHVTSVTDRTLTCKNNTYTVGNKALKVSSNSGTATQAITTNESSSDRTLKIAGDGTYITGAVSGSSNAAVVTLSHANPTADANSELTASISGTAGTYAKDTEYTVLTGVKAQRDAKGHITGLTYTAQKIKDTNNTYTGYNIAF